MSANTRSLSVQTYDNGVPTTFSRGSTTIRKLGQNINTSNRSRAVWNNSRWEPFKSKIHPSYWDEEIVYSLLNTRKLGVLKDWYWYRSK